MIRPRADRPIEAVDGSADPPPPPDAIEGFRPTWLQVDLDALADNLSALRRRVGPARVIAVVKADAYGHGAVAVARRLEAERADALAVATAEEGLELRAAGLRSPILVMGAVSPGQLPALWGERIVPTAYSLGSLEAILAEGRRLGRAVPFHLKLDSGMGRLGLLPEQVPDAYARLIAAREHATLDGLMTHLSCSDDPDDPHTPQQVSTFTGLVEQARALGLTPRWVHAASSGAILDHPASWFDAVRPGIALYGIHPSPRSSRLDLTPILSFKTRLILVKQLPAGRPVGYGHAFVTRRPSVIGTVAAGYADGIGRAVSGIGSALVRGRRAPYAGRVSMDSAALDLTDVPGAAEGDEVVLVGGQGQEEITVVEMADWSGTIPYEVLCRLGPRVARLHQQGGARQKTL